MKLYEAFFLAFICSLLAGAFLFLGVPLICAVAINNGDTSIIYTELSFLLLAMFIIYAIIQFLLTAINLLQAIYLASTDQLDPEVNNLLKYFVIAEAILYLCIFVGLNILIRELQATPFILGFSVPYIICCTASIYFFLYFLRKLKPAR